MAADAFWFGELVVEENSTLFRHSDSQLFTSGEKLVCGDVTIVVVIEGNDLFGLANRKSEDCLEFVGLEMNGGDTQSNIMGPRQIDAAGCDERNNQTSPDMLDFIGVQVVRSVEIFNPGRKEKRRSTFSLAAVSVNQRLMVDMIASVLRR